MVEIEGMRGFPTACTTPVSEGMAVRTNSEALRELRRNILALMMLEHPSACLICERRELCDDLIEIPMHGQKESFNVSVAAGIALYTLSI